MRYIFPLTAPYSYINHALCLHDTPLEFSVFSDIILNYVQACVRRWLFNHDYASSQNMLNVGLKYLLTTDEVDDYLMYLDHSFWPMINMNIVEDITPDTSVIVTITSDGAIMLDIEPSMSPLQLVLEKVYIDVEHKLDSGEYIHPTVMEIYNASRTTSPNI